MMRILQILVLFISFQWTHSQNVTINEIITTGAPTEAIAPNDIDESLTFTSPVAQVTAEPSFATVTAVSTVSNAVTQAETTNTRPTPYPTYYGTYSPPTDDIFAQAFPSTISVYAVLTITFPSNTTYNESAIDDISSTIESFLSNRGNFSSSVSVSMVLEDTYGMAPPAGEGESQISATIQVTVPWMEMNFIDEYTLQLILAQVMEGSQDDLVQKLSDAFGFDMESSGVQVSFVVIFTPPTSMPTMSPTTTEQKNAKRRKIRRRSWLLVTLFWVIVLCCFSLENGLCACRFGKRKEEYAGVELGSGGFD